MRIALGIARAVAAGRGDDNLTPIHIALGLVREGENSAIAVFEHRGVPTRSLRRDLERGLGPPPGRPQPDEVVLALTAGEERLVQQARAYAQRDGDDYVGPEHLLLAILAEEKSPAAQILARHGIRSETATDSMRVVIHKH